MNNTTQTQKEIMSRVRFVYYGRKVVNGATVKALALILSVASSTAFFSVKNVFANMLTVPVSNVYDFSLSAFSNTRPIVQLLFLVASIFFVWMLRDIVKTIRASRHSLNLVQS